MVEASAKKGKEKGKLVEVTISILLSVRQQGEG